MGIYRREVYRSRTMVVEFEMDRNGMRKVAGGAELRLAVGIIARKGLAYAESIAPERTGDYKRSFDVVMSRVVVAGMRRVAAKLVNTDPAAAAIEWGAHVGGGETPAHRTLGRTLAFLGSVPEPRGALGTPTRRTEPLKAIRPIDQFRRDRQRAIDRDRRHRRRLRQSGRD